METNKKYAITVAPLYRGRVNAEKMAQAYAAAFSFDELTTRTQAYLEGFKAAQNYWNQYEFEIKDRNVAEVKTALESLTTGAKFRVKALGTKSKETSPDAFLELYTKEQVDEEKAAYFARKNQNTI